MPMNYLDIVLAIPLLWGLYKGLSSGIIKELASLAALLLGIYGAVHFSEKLQPILIEQLSVDPDLLPAIAFGATFILIVLLVRLLGLMIDKLVKLVALGLLSRLLGGLFGVLKAAFVLSALLLIVNGLDAYMDLIPKKQKKQSVLYTPISQLVPALLPEANDSKPLLKEAEQTLKKIEKTIPL